jgi:hypothetical protein
MSIEAYPSPNGVLTSLIWRKTAAGGETSLSGYDNASQALSYTPGQEQVYLNGILLVRGSDYTATNGTSVTGLTALAADDFVQINCYNNFSVASVPAASITGEVTNSQITSLATTKLTGTITNAQLAGSIANDKLANSSITINGSAVALGGSATIAGGSAQDTAPSSPTEGQLWLDTDGTLATTAFVEKSTLTTTGDLFYASSANTPARLGIGSTSQVLTVSGGLPVWSAPAAGGMTLLSTTTLSGASSITISSISQDYNELHIYIYGVTNNTTYGVLFCTAYNGATALNASGYRPTQLTSGYIDFARSTSSGFRLSDDANSYFTRDRTNANNAWKVIFANYASTTSPKPLQSFGTFMNSDGEQSAYSNTGGIWDTSAVNSIVVSNSGGTFSAGTVKIYGVK